MGREVVTFMKIVEYTPWILIETKSIHLYNYCIHMHIWELNVQGDPK